MLLYIFRSLLSLFFREWNDEKKIMCLRREETRAMLCVRTQESANGKKCRRKKKLIFVLTGAREGFVRRRTWCAFIFLFRLLDIHMFRLVSDNFLSARWMNALVGWSASLNKPSAGSIVVVLCVWRPRYRLCESESFVYDFPFDWELTTFHFVVDDFDPTLGFYALFGCRLRHAILTANASIRNAARV